MTQPELVPPALPPSPPPEDARGTSRERQSFGEQAARFSLYAPIAAIVINFATMTNKEPGVGMAIGWINLTLVLLGFVLGIAALVSMRTYGRRRILGRATVGVLLNTLILVSAASFLLPAYRAKQVREQVVGAWRLQATPGGGGPSGQLDITFKPDGTFQLARSDGDGILVGSLSGKWVFSRNKQVGVVVERAEGAAAYRIGETVGLGQVRSIDERQMILKTDKGEEVFRRLP